MQLMRLLAVSGVTMAAGAMISLWLAVSPSLTLLPPLPMPVGASDTVTSERQQSIETVGAATDDSFDSSGQKDDDTPPIPAPKRDLLEGLIGGLMTRPLEEDASQVRQVEPNVLTDLSRPQQQELVTAELQEPPTRPSDVCDRQGLRKVYYTQNHHRYWRCVGRR